MRKVKNLLNSLIWSTAALHADCIDNMLHDLKTAERIDAERKDQLPFFYDFSMIGGHFNMPSARMPAWGMFGFGAARPPPYNIYGISFQPFDRIEVSVNYRVYKGMMDKNFGHLGFGDEAERIGNVKLAILSPYDGFPNAPSIAIGADDFIGTSRFNSQYGVITKQWMPINLETSLGWSRGRMKGFFGGAIWTPFRKSSIFLLENLSLIGEYDNIDYKFHPHEHPDGRKVKSRVNIGLGYLGVGDMLQATIGSLRGTKVAGSASFRYPLGTTKGFLPKVKDPLPYTCPIDTEPLGVMRPECEFVLELAYAFDGQGLDLCCAYVQDTKEGKKLYLTVINNVYREESIVRDRMQDLLAALVPSNVVTTTITLESDAVPVQSYTFRTEDLRRFRVGLTSAEELAVLSPMIEAVKPPKHSVEIFKKNKDIWTFTFRPRFLTFFGGATGKFKYNIGLIASPEGYLGNQIYYKVQLGYSIYSTMWSLGDIDKLNPSQIPNVRTDTIRYYQNNTISLEKAFVQKSFNLGKGCFWRLAGGYFEIAYGGLAGEFLYYPVTGNWAIGLEGAAVMKRHYKWLGFTNKIRKLDGTTPHFIKFYGSQAFLDIYYFFRPLHLEFKVQAGQFLAKDWGGRFQVTRQFPSGLRLTLWYMVTNGHDKLNGNRYYDKGFAFAIPLDFFLTKSSRTYIGYAMSAWLRDIGAEAETGKPLYFTLREERNLDGY